jgi:hypothetical protein
MTVGFVDAVETGRLFAGNQRLILTIPSCTSSSSAAENEVRAQVVRAEWKKEKKENKNVVHVHERVVSSCKIRPACKILR